MNSEDTPKKDELEKQESSGEGKADDLRKQLIHFEKTGIGFPFDFSVVENLYELRNEPIFGKLIEEKQSALEMMIRGIEKEIELGYFKNDEREQNVYRMLKELTGEDKKQ